MPARLRTVALAIIVGLTTLVLVPASGATRTEDPRIRPGFLTAPRDGDPVEIALDHLRAHPGRYGVEANDLRSLRVTDRYASAHTGLTHVYLRQAIDGLDLLGSSATVNVARDGSILYVGARLVPGVASASGQPALGAVGAAEAAAEALGLAPTRPLVVTSGGPERATLTTGGISLSPIPAHLVYQATRDGRIRLAWNLEIEEISQRHWWNASVDAETGELLARTDYVDHDSAEATAAAIAPARTASATSSSTAGDGASYHVYALPLESPNDGPRSVVTSPAHATASPLGWHDTDGAAGPESTVTRGNAVHAYTDHDNNGAPDPGSDPDGGPGLAFDFPIDFTAHPHDYAPAAVTNLFYWNNIIHDVFYGYGFTEAAGNFQINTYGRGGTGGDDVRAEAQDGGGTNNANFSTPADGSRPRMQMYLWQFARPFSVTIDAPSSAAGTYQAAGASFGAQLDLTGVAGSIALVNDGLGTSPGDGCEPVLDFPAGSIALVDRSTCPADVQALNAQQAGATAVIMANNVAGNPSSMSGTNPLVTIPSVMVSQDAGTAIKAGLPATGRVHRDPIRGVNRDGDLDAGIITHEYGHGISNRLTGGPNVVGCLGNQEQMGEGWSDWLAVSLTALPSESGPQPRGIGTYALYTDARTAKGIRPTAYSTDLSINPSTHDTIKTAAVPHGVGYVWATMLWDVYWNLVKAHGFNPDVYGDWTTGGNNLAIQLVMDGMKIQPCSPGFVDGRNAILAADVALTGGENACRIWRGFAKRGLGHSASQGTSTSRSDGTQAFDLPPECRFAFQGFFGSLKKPGLVDAKAGSTVPAIFSLGGNRGLDVFADGSPSSQRIDCLTGLALGAAEPTTAREDGLTYDPSTDRYTYPWGTDRGWADTCRRLTVAFNEGTVATADLRFTK